MRFDKFTYKAQEALQEVQSVAHRFNHQEIRPEHLLYVLVEQGEGVIPALLQRLGVKPDMVRSAIETEIKRLPKVYSEGGAAEAYLSRDLVRLLETAVQEATSMKDEYCSTEHILLAMADDKSSAVGKTLQAFGVTRDAILATLAQIRGSQRVTDQQPEATYDALGKYTRDLTDLARKGKLDPVIGRDEEIRRVMQVLSRRTKNNPVLIGEPGVGKTAIVEDLRSGL